MQTRWRIAALIWAKRSGASPKNGTGETGRADSMRRSPGVRMKCNKDCIANVCGECAVEKCEGQIQRLGMRNNNAETAAWTYKIAVDSFKDYFGKKDADQ